MTRSFRSIASVSTFAFVCFAACGSSEGSEGAACYPNGTCDEGLVCSSDEVCESPSSSGIDLSACFECGDAACASARSECDGTTGCPEILECTLGCGTDTACVSQCDVSGLTQEQAVAATMAVASYVSCTVPACQSECLPDLPSGSGGGTGAGGTTGAGGSGFDGEACQSCAETSCPNETAACAGVPSCSTLVECALGCGTDQACAQECAAAIPAEEAADAAYGSIDLLTCAATSCTTECSAGGFPGTGGGSSTGGGTSTGGSPSAGGGPSTGGGASTGGGGSLGPGELFSGTGVSIDAPDYGAVGNFFVLEDGVADGAVVSDSLSHSDLDPPESSSEPSTFESSTAPCVSGTIAVVTDAAGANCEINDSDCVWGDLWGGGIGLTLNEADSTAAAWDASAVGVTGFEFSISGSVDGVPIRFFVEDTSGNQFCTDVSTGSSTIPFSVLAHECWNPTALDLDPTKIKQISWQFVPDASYSYSISNFCVEELSVRE